MTQAINSAGTSPDCDSPEYWGNKLSASCRQAQIETASLGIINNRSIITVQYGYSKEPGNSTVARHPAFCVAKLFTSTLVSILVLQGKLQFENDVSDLLPAAPGPHRITDDVLDVLKGITVSHLLSHTHGLSSTGLTAAPVNANGFIDYANVHGSLQKAGRIFRPGHFYSYGVEGYILLGLIIEHVMQKTYREVLHEEVLTHVSDHSLLQSAASNGDLPTLPICPSSGTGLKLTVNELLAFAGCLLEPATNALGLGSGIIAEIFATRKLLPGWSPTISGCCYGWKKFADGWYGQNGMASRNLMYVRLHPAHNTAICLVAHSEKRNPGALASLLFQHAYPALGFSVSGEPAILTDQAADSCNAIIGTYGDRHTRFIVGLNNDRLVLTVAAANDDNVAVSHHCYLYPAENNIFFLSKPWQFVTFLQLVKDDYFARYLWDHTQLWPEWIN